MNRKPKVGVVLVSWDVPPHRLHQHFEWNEEVYRHGNCHVFVVTDMEHALPEYASCVVFPADELPLIEGRRRFSLTRTKNAGLRAAIQAECSPIICTDVDIWYQPASWLLMTRCPEHSAVVPVYLMSSWDDPEVALDRFEEAPLATGTVCMHSDDWLRTGGYCEAQWGYGCDDGLILKRIHCVKDPPIKLLKTTYLVHMAHQPGTPQVEFNKKQPRVDHWNRTTGFNPENFDHNKRFHLVDDACLRKNDLLEG